MSTAAAVGGLRRPLFIAALIVALVVVLAEVGLSYVVVNAVVDTPGVVATDSLGVTDTVVESGADTADPPGAGIAHLALIDGLILFTVLMLGLSLVMPLRLYGRAQGVTTLVVSVLWILMCFVLGMLALVKLMLMISLFVSFPFGTAAYLAIWGGFPTGAAATVLGIVLALKIAFAVLLVLSQPRFLRVKGLVILVLVSVLLQLILGFVHGFLPGPVVAIGDQLWAVVLAVAGIIWALIMLIGSIPAILNAIRVSGSLVE